MQFAIVLVVVLAIFGALVITGLLWVIRGRERSAAEVARLGDDRTLTYTVPVGQDPAPVLGALRSEGYEAVLQGSEITVACPAGADRERARVRAVISSSPLDMEGDPSPTRDVRFPDEDPDEGPDERPDEARGS
ncbi:hypothetical protein ncot_12140 [Nocardioides sp. JQ2195]|uniref:hypothetical protein n=1 Tax=Nocardioides sp. JQ2195 TaxID=2592334 RepID=UPI00143E99A7|nr:hypothetical protein [Nocardioides sp. JQ2195]QIX27265.1 hypothetical protein ncot_12140 [Nocardioides sp. JQ2195]